MNSTEIRHLFATVANIGNPITSGIEASQVGYHSCQTSPTILVPIPTGSSKNPLDFIRTERKPKISYEVRRMEGGNGSLVRKDCELYNKAVAAAQKQGIAVEGSHTEVFVTMDGGSGRSFCCRVWAREGY